MPKHHARNIVVGCVFVFSLYAIAYVAFALLSPLFPGMAVLLLAPLIVPHYNFIILLPVGYLLLFILSKTNVFRRYELSPKAIGVVLAIVMLLVAFSFRSYTSVVSEKKNAESEHRIATEEAAKSLFYQILSTKDASKCTELSKYAAELEEVIPNPYHSISYALFSENDCKQIVEGNYAYFSSHPLLKSDQTLSFEPYYLWGVDEGGWKAIFTAHGYMHCQRQNPTLLLHSGVSLSDFCLSEEAVRTSSVNLCLNMVDEPGRFNWYESGISKLSCIRRVALKKKDPNLCTNIMRVLEASYGSSDRWKRESNYQFSECKRGIETNSRPCTNCEIPYFLK